MRAKKKRIPKQHNLCSGGGVGGGEGGGEGGGREGGEIPGLPPDRQKSKSSTEQIHRYVCAMSVHHCILSFPRGLIIACLRCVYVQ